MYTCVISLRIKQKWHFGDDTERKNIYLYEQAHLLVVWTEDSSARLVRSHFPNTRNKIRIRFLFCRCCSIFPGGRRRVCHYPGGRCLALRTLFSRIARLSVPGNTYENEEKMQKKKHKGQTNAQAGLLRFDRQTNMCICC